MAEVELHPIEKTHLPLLQKWRNSADVMPYCRQYRPLTMEDMQIWHENLHKDRDFNLTNDFFLLVSDGHPIGVGGLTRIDWRNRKGEVSLYAAVKKDTENLLEKALCRIMEYAFATLNLHKVYFPVYSFNPYLKVYERCMTREYTAKSEYYWNGTYYDRVVLSKFSTSCHE